jgi:hypothetical protein
MLGLWSWLTRAAFDHVLVPGLPANAARANDHRAPQLEDPQAAAEILAGF